jgi:tRNA modification GTPase
VAHQPNSRRGSEGQEPSLSAGDTIAAISTPPGRGGIGVVRVSGRGTADVARSILGFLPIPRQAVLGDFRDARGELIDRGIALFFPAPRSYTGEDVLELQGHGGPLVMQQLLARCVAAGSRMAEPGEFTRRAYLNNRIDLAQAESVADLIDAASIEAARSAARSLAGDFSRRIEALASAIIDLRVHVEACIDFPEEEIDASDRAAIERKRISIAADLRRLLASANQGVVLREGLTVALIGRPNVGKSSLLNRLAGEELAIVTPIPGTTRDPVRATIAIEGVPVHLIDTAGLRESEDPVERIGVERTWAAVQTAGAALLIDAVDEGAGIDERIAARLPHALPRAYVLNKIDLAERRPEGPVAPVGEGVFLPVSAKSGAGLPALRSWLLERAGWRPAGEGVFMARARHVQALCEALECVTRAGSTGEVFELAAEELRLAAAALGRIVGEVSADDLLGEIFGRFCIGK